MRIYSGKWRLVIIPILILGWGWACGGGNGNSSSVSSPSSPSNLQATVASSSQINLSWTDNSNSEDGFKIERKTGSGGTYAQIGTVVSGVANYQDTGLTCAATYSYRVLADNGAGNSGYSNETSATTEPCPATIPMAPSNLQATTVSSSKIDLSWTDNSNDEDGFMIERKKGSDGTYSQIGTVGSDVINYQDTGLSCEKIYYYLVRANNGTGNSDYSDEANATTSTCPWNVGHVF